MGMRIMWFIDSVAICAFLLMVLFFFGQRFELVQPLCTLWLITGCISFVAHGRQ